jgi:hypothetical protein
LIGVTAAPERALRPVEATVASAESSRKSPLDHSVSGSVLS